MANVRLRATRARLSREILSKPVKTETFPEEEVEVFIKAFA